MINFTVGPVQSCEAVHKIGAQDVPYFRTQEFSDVMLQNEELMLKFAGAPEGSRVVFITGSGTASLEAAVINTLDASDKVLVVNGGSFGQRFCDLCEVHNLNYTAIAVERGHALTAEDLAPYEGAGYTAFLTQMHETSTAVLYDMALIGEFCKRNNLFLVVDAISAFLADPFDMAAVGADIMITGSQKALACPPGISIDVLGPRALERVARINSGCMYLDFKSALKNGERGQTPFTPAVGTLLQINARLKEIDAAGGVEASIAHTAELATYFRNIAFHNQSFPLPFKPFSESPSNACTSLCPTTASARDIFLTLKDEYGIWVCPNGGDMAETVFRVGHIGDLTRQDYRALQGALIDMQRRGLI